MLTNLVRDIDDHDLSVLHTRNTQNGIVGVACVNPLQKQFRVRVEVFTDLVHVHGDPMFPWLVAVVCVAHESGRVRRDDFG